MMNHLSGFLLTQILLPALLNQAGKSEAYSVFISLLGYENSALNFDNLNLDHNYGTLKAYGRSRLMNRLTARELHRRW